MISKILVIFLIVSLLININFYINNEDNNSFSFSISENDIKYSPLQIDEREIINNDTRPISIRYEVIKDKRLDFIKSDIILWNEGREIVLMPNQTITIQLRLIIDIDTIVIDRQTEDITIKIWGLDKPTITYRFTRTIIDIR